MINNYLKIALRNLRRKPVYALLNITGLAVGIACSIMVLLYVYDEYSYDRHHEKAERIYRLNVDVRTPNETTQQAVSSVLMGPNLAGDFQAVESMVRFTGTSGRFQYKENVFSEGDILYADSTVFDIFSFELLRGNPGEALANPNGIVLTEQLARKFFGEEDPMGKTLKVLDKETEVTVTGILKEQPRTSRFDFNMLMAMQVWHNTNSWSDDEWFVSMYNTYLLLSEGSSPATLEAQFPAFLDRHIGSEMKENEKTYELSLQPLADIYLHSDRIYQIGPSGNAAAVYIFSAVGFLILLVACINFMNLSTARSMDRAREVGIRKTAGGHRLQLAGQFMAEALLMSFLALAVAYTLCIQLLPLFNEFAGKEINSEIFYRVRFILTFLGIGLGAGLLSGIYPAAVLSGFRPADVLRGSHFHSQGGKLFRKGLVVFQFTLSLLLIAGTLVIQKQLSFMQQSDMGFEREAMLVVNFQGDDRPMQQWETLKQEYEKHPAIKGVAITDRLPGMPGNRSMTTFYRKDGERHRSNMNTYFVGYDFIDVYGLQLIAGKNFPRDFVPDTTFRFIVNRSTLPLLGQSMDRPREAVGMRMNQFETDGTITGVVEDFHFRSLHHRITPISLVLYPWASSFATLKVDTANLTESLSDFSDIWKQFAPDLDFDYLFLDDYLDRQYRAEQKFSRIAISFTLLAIVIACLGLLGLTGYTVQKRSREISVRKVLGASVPDILYLLTRQYIVLIGLALLFAVPIARYLLQQWLQNFAYRTPVGWQPFAASALILIVIALATISRQTVKAALSNPAETLKEEA